MRGDELSQTMEREKVGFPEAVEIVARRRAKAIGPICEMGVDEWVTVADNPRQRDTERHLRRARHLRSPSPTHAHVAMAVAPSGERWKLDGHTRALAWERKMLAWPERLFVAVYQVEDAAGAADLYQQFDNALAVENTTDKVFGAFREQEWVPESQALKSGVITAALRLANGIAMGTRAPTLDANMSVYDLVNAWLPELKALDKINLDRRRFPGPFFAAALLSLRRHGIDATEFWRLYNDDAGQKIGDEMDGVEALSRLQMSRNESLAGNVAVIALLGKALSAFEAYRVGKTYTGGIKPTEPSKYIPLSKR